MLPELHKQAPIKCPFNYLSGFFAKKVLTDLGHISIIRPALSDEVITKEMAK